MKAAARGLAMLPATEAACRRHATRCHEGWEVCGPMKTAQPLVLLSYGYAIYRGPNHVVRATSTQHPPDAIFLAFPAEPILLVGPSVCETLSVSPIRR